MDTHNGLYGLKRVFARLVRIIDIGFRDLDIFSKSGYKVNVLFTVSVDGGAYFEILFDCFLK